MHRKNIENQTLSSHFCTCTHCYTANHSACQGNDATPTRKSHSNTYGFAPPYDHPYTPICQIETTEKQS